MDAIVMFAVGMFHVFVFMVGLPRESSYNPLSFLYGMEYEVEEWNEEILQSWLLVSVFLCVLTVWKIYRNREEAVYMRLARYGGWRSYYRSVLLLLLRSTFLNHLALAVGSLSAFYFMRGNGYQIQISFSLFFCAVAAIFLNNLLFGLIASGIIIRCHRLRLSFVAYPVLQILMCFWGSQIPLGNANRIPATWGMINRSSLLMEGGFPCAGSMVAEVVLIVFLSVIVQL